MVQEAFFSHFFAFWLSMTCSVNPLGVLRLENVFWSVRPAVIHVWDAYPGSYQWRPCLQGVYFAFWLSLAWCFGCPEAKACLPGCQPCCQTCLGCMCMFLLLRTRPAGCAFSHFWMRKTCAINPVSVPWLENVFPSVRYAVSSPWDACEGP